MFLSFAFYTFRQLHIKIILRDLLRLHVYALYYVVNDNLHRRKVEQTPVGC